MHLVKTADSTNQAVKGNSFDWQAQKLTGIINVLCHEETSYSQSLSKLESKPHYWFNYKTVIQSLDSHLHCNDECVITESTQQGNLTGGRGRNELHIVQKEDSARDTCTCTALL